LVFVLADMVESRDKETGGHVERTALYLKILIEGMQQRGLYLDEIRQLNIESAVSSARLHDVGKIAIPDGILNKPGKLTPEEFETMKSHVEEGAKIIDQIVSRTGEVAFLRNARLFVCYHHERWDGRGYPYGLAGEEIPLHGRIMAVVDVYDALISVRPYKEAFSQEKAIDIIMESAGKQFDPAIAKVFYEVREQLFAVSTDLNQRTASGFHSLEGYPAG
ncbi:MAG: HD domain-containing protein, partial [Symbiobacteriaceae bacterium]|nr:HD domain-containing protein [Symbiobacteriaceae bacterium]